MHGIVFYTVRYSVGAALRDDVQFCVVDRPFYPVLYSKESTDLYKARMGHLALYLSVPCCEHLIGISYSGKMRLKPHDRSRRKSQPIAKVFPTGTTASKGWVRS